MWPELYNLLLVLVCVSGPRWTLSVLSLTVLVDSAEPLHSKTSLFCDTFKQQFPANAFTLVVLLVSGKYFCIHSCRLLVGLIHNHSYRNRSL